MKAHREFKTLVIMLVLSIGASIFTNGYSLIATPLLLIGVIIYLNRMK